jgi:hypothetical protein
MKPNRSVFGLRATRAAITAALAVIVAACGGGGQATYTLSGAVFDALTDAGVQHASVTLTGSASSSTTSDMGGRFSFGGLASGSYTVTVTRKIVALASDSANLLAVKIACTAAP